MSGEVRNWGTGELGNWGTGELGNWGREGRRKELRRYCANVFCSEGSESGEWVRCGRSEGGEFGIRRGLLGWCDGDTMYI
jgi:hypothetical protein